jgi:hypothetical protein
MRANFIESLFAKLTLSASNLLGGGWFPINGEGGVFLQVFDFSTERLDRVFVLMDTKVEGK